MMWNGTELFICIFFCLIVSIQLFYYWYFFAKLAFYKEVVHENFTASPVSIIICAKDEANNLIHNFPAWLSQDYPFTTELVLVNDNSYDDTKQVIEQFKKEHKIITAIHLTDEAQFLQGKKFPLSMGIKASKYELLLLTDADCTPASANWIRNMQHSFTEEIDLVLGYGAYKKRKGFLNKVIRFETFHTALQYLSYALAGMAYMGVGRNIAYKKTLYKSVNGFKNHSTIPSGDDDLFVNEVATKTNTTININPESFTYSKPKQTWQEWRRQKQRHMSTGKYYKPIHKFLLGLYSFSQVVLYPSLLLAVLFLLQNGIGLIIIAAFFIVRLVSMMLIWFKTMNKLNEKDLKRYFWFWDIWLAFYFLKNIPSVLKKASKQWK